MSDNPEDYELFHYGVKGMKWGARKADNDAQVKKALDKSKNSKGIVLGETVIKRAGQSVVSQLATNLIREMAPKEIAAGAAFVNQGVQTYVIASGLRDVVGIARYKEDS